MPLVWFTASLEYRTLKEMEKAIIRVLQVEGGGVIELFSELRMLGKENLASRFDINLSELVDHYSN